MHMQTYFCRLVWILAGCCLGCQGIGNENSFAVTLPSLPSGWRSSLGVDTFQLRYFDGQGRLIDRAVSWDASTIDIEPGKGAVVPILAEPCVSGSAFDPAPPKSGATSGFSRAVTAEPDLRLRPAGAVAPFDTSEAGTTELTWRRGFACAILLELAQNGISIDGYNCERLLREIDEKAPGDPFDLDRTGIIASMLSGSFRVTDIKFLDRQEIELMPGRGSWFTESPFSSLYETEENEALSLSLTLGLHHVFDLSGKARFDIQVDEQEVTVLQVRP